MHDKQRLPGSDLATRQCRSCQPGSSRLTPAQVEALRERLGATWRIVNGHHLLKAFHFGSFREALAFANRVGAVAEEQDHHPDILVSYGRVRLTIWTHAVDGLTEDDFILAAKVDRIR